jgi:hypothetical protein
VNGKRSEYNSHKHKRRESQLQAGERKVNMEMDEKWGEVQLKSRHERENENMK